MAHCLLTTPLPGSSSAVIRVFHRLKRLPDDYFIAQRLTALHGSGPDFFLLHQNRRGLLLSVCPTTLQEAQAVLQPDLFTQTQPEPVGAAVQAGLEEFLRQIPPATGGLLFPHLPESTLTQVWSNGQMPGAGQEMLAPEALAEWVEAHLSPVLDVDAVARLRQAFSPEVTVPVQFTVCQPPQRRLEAGLGDYLLDYNQERVLKSDLALTPEAKTAAREFGLHLVNGIAGSGKSLVVIYRAHLLRQLFPQKRILVLTHNRALIRDLRRRYRHLSDGDQGVAFHTFMGWCRKYWPEMPTLQKWRAPIRWSQRRQMIAETWYEHLAGTAVTEQMLQEEIDWYKDRLLFSLEDYLAADRTGRGFALNEMMRRRVYEAMAAYHQRLQAQQTMDWGDVPRQIWRFLEAGELKPPQYDAILVDEAQFFAPLWFEIIKQLLRPVTGHLFLVADPGQGFLKRRQSWLASGLDVRGRAYRLNRSYRTTREILDFATLLYRNRLPDDDDDIVPPDMRHMPHGVLPVVIPLTSEQDETTRVVNEIRQLHEAGIPWGHILVIHASRDETRPLLNRLQRAFGPDTAVDPGQVNAYNQIRVCSLNGATGLESPIVFLMGLHDLYEQEQSVRLSDEERVELIHDNTRRLYMAITRAGQRLVMTYVGAVPPALHSLTEHLTVVE